MIDTQAVQVLNILEVVNAAGDEIDLLDVKLNMNDEFLVAMAVLKFDKYKNLCNYFVWDRRDYKSKPFEVELFQCAERPIFPFICSNLLNIPVISKDGNLLLNGEEKYSHKPELNCEEVNLRIKFRMSKEITFSPFTPPTINYRHNNSMISHPIEYNRKNLHIKTLIFRNEERFVWQNKFSAQQYIIGWSENYVAFSIRALRRKKDVTVFRLTDGKEVFKLVLCPPKSVQGLMTASILRSLLQKRKSEIEEVQFSRNRIACKGRVLRNSGEEHPPFDLYILDFATGKVILECNQDLKLPDVKKFLFHEDSLVLEQGNKIVLTKFWL